MPSQAESVWLQALRCAFADTEDADATISVGSICTGTEIVGKTLELISQYWLAMYNVNAKVNLLFQCEKDVDKQGHVQAHCPAKYLFADAKDMRKTRAVDVMSGEKVVIPWVTLLCAGFPCTSRTSLSSKAKNNVNCVQGAFGSTGEVFSDIWQYIKMSVPKLVILENVVPLEAKDPKGQQPSDAEFIVAQLRQIGYFADYLRFDCQDATALPWAIGHCQNVLKLKIIVDFTIDN